MSKNTSEVVHETVHPGPVGGLPGFAVWLWRQEAEKEIRRSLTEQIKARQTARKAIHFEETEYDRTVLAGQIEQEMLEAAQELDFERAAFLRDQLKELRDLPELVIASKTKKETAKRARISTRKQKNN